MNCQDPASEGVVEVETVAYVCLTCNIATSFAPSVVRKQLILQGLFPGWYETSKGVEPGTVTVIWTRCVPASWAYAQGTQRSDLESMIRRDSSDHLLKAIADACGAEDQRARRTAEALSSAAATAEVAWDVESPLAVYKAAMSRLTASYWSLSPRRR